MNGFEFPIFHSFLMTFSVSIREGENLFNSNTHAEHHNLLIWIHNSQFYEGLKVLNTFTKKHAIGRGGQWIKKKRTNLKIITCDVNCKIKANKCAKLFMETLKLLLLLLFAFFHHIVVALRKKYFNSNTFLWSTKEEVGKSGRFLCYRLPYAAN